MEHRPSHRGDYRYDDYYPDAIDISFHRTKVVVSPAAGAAQVASAEEPAYRKYADQDKYYEEDEEKYYEVDEYGHESLGPIVIGHSLIAKVCVCVCVGLWLCLVWPVQRDRRVCPAGPMPLP